MLRNWSIKHSRAVESLYNGFEQFLLWLHPLFTRIGYERLEKPMTMLERPIKGLLFDCQMCGKCILSSTGMSCPMNCPKNIRNGPCGGVRLNGHCEIKPEMKCVWVEAYRGSLKMRNHQGILKTQLDIDHSIRGSSAWLRQTRLNYQQKQSGRN